MAAQSAERNKRRDTLNIRVKPGERHLIDRAAEVVGKTPTDFVLDAARRAAVDVLAERTRFAVDAKTYARFAAALDAPPRRNAKLRSAMRTPAPWDRV